jgi:hypothetical protein
MTTREEFDGVFGKVLKALPLVPKEGFSGSFKCPACEDGTVYWRRAPRNKHLRLQCSTPNCVWMFQ